MDADQIRSLLASGAAGVPLPLFGQRSPRAGTGASGSAVPSAARGLDSGAARGQLTAAAPFLAEESAPLRLSLTAAHHIGETEAGQPGTEAPEHLRRVMQVTSATLRRAAAHHSEEAASPTEQRDTLKASREALLTRAAGHYRAALRADPEHLTACTNLASVAVAMQRPQLALRLAECAPCPPLAACRPLLTPLAAPLCPCSGVLAATPSDCGALEVRSAANFLLGRVDSAISDATAVACQAIGGLARAQTRAGEVLASRGAMLEAVGERHAALEDYRAAIALDGGCAAALYNAGTSFLRRGMVADGLQQLSLALRADPLLLPAYVNRALARARQYECAAAARPLPSSPHGPLPVGPLQLCWRGGGSGARCRPRPMRRQRLLQRLAAHAATGALRRCRDAADTGARAAGPERRVNPFS